MNEAEVIGCWSPRMSDIVVKFVLRACVVFALVFAPNIEW